MHEIIFIVLKVLIFSVAFFLYFAVVLIIHEALHKIMLRRYGIRYTSERKGFGYNIRVNMDRVDFRYINVAMAPYVFLFPIFAIMFMSNDFYISLFGIIFMIHHMINYPLEFVKVKWRTDKDGFEREIDKKAVDG